MDDYGQLFSTILADAERLENAGIPATVRRQLGSEIDGACGQLRLRQQAAEAHTSKRRSAEHSDQI